MYTVYAIFCLLSYTTLLMYLNKTFILNKVIILDKLCKFQRQLMPQPE